MTTLQLVEVVLGVYALLLAVGGVIGYTKAGSRPSLIAGIMSAFLAFMALLITPTNPRLGLGTAAVVALALAGLFGYRFFAKSRKFMPAGLLAIMSVIVLVLAIVCMP
jgi:uncharacterized membrane protein (UPF0136 family)